MCVFNYFYEGDRLKRIFIPNFVNLKGGGNNDVGVGTYRFNKLRNLWKFTNK